MKVTKKPVKKIPIKNAFVNAVFKQERMKLEDQISDLQIKVHNLQHQIVGFRAVISYLEDLSGIRNSQ